MQSLKNLYPNPVFNFPYEWIYPFLEVRDGNTPQYAEFVFSLKQLKICNFHSKKTVLQNR